MQTWRLLPLQGLLWIALFTPALAAPIPIADVNRATPVEFQKEILPLLQKSCLACHNKSEANGDLVLESPQTMIQGGDSGPAVVPGKSGESLLLKLAAHQQDPLMPPPGNDVAAPALSSQELGLLKLWIDQGARGESEAALLSPARWRPLPPGNHPVLATAVTPDGQFAACGRANQIFIYHVPTGQLLTRLTDPALQAGSDSRPGIAHLDYVQSLAFNSQGDTLASGGFRTVKLWRYPRDVQRLAWTAAQSLRAVAVSPDRQWIAAGAADGQITLWSLAESAAPVAATPGAATPGAATPGAETPAASAAPRSLSGHAAELTSLCFTDDSLQLVSAAADSTIRVWNVVDGELTGRIDAPAIAHALTVFREPLPAVAGSDPATAGPPEQVLRLASGGADNLVRIWNVPDQLPRPLAFDLANCQRMAVNRQAQLLAVANPSGMVGVIDLASGQLVKQWQAHPGGVTALALAPESALAGTLATGGDNGLVRLWNARTAEPLLDLRGTLAPVLGLDFRHDGQQLASSAADGGVTIWNLQAVESRSLADPTADVAQSLGPASQVVLSPDGKWLASAGSASGRDAIVVRELASGKVWHTLLGHEGPITSLAFSGDGTRIASGSADKTARIWDLRDAKFPEVARFAGHSAEVTAVAFNSDAAQVLSGSADNTARLWNAADGQELMVFNGHTGPVVAVAMPANNQPMTASADKTVRVWNPANGQAAANYAQPAAVTALALSRDSQRMAVATADNAVRILAAAGGGVQQTLAGHKLAATHLAFSPDNSRLLSASSDGRLLVWDTADGRLLQGFENGDASGQVANQEAAEAAPPSEQSAGQKPVATVIAATFGPAADRLIVAGSEGGLVLRSLRVAGVLRGMTKAATAVKFHPAGQTVLAGCEDGTIRGYNLANFQQAFAANHGAAVRDLALADDGQRMASGGDDKLIKLWNPTNGGALQPAQLGGFAAPVVSVTMSADGLRVVGASSAETGEIRVFQAVPPAGVAEQSIVGHAVAVQACLLLDGAGRGASLSSDGKLLLWDLPGVRALAGHTQPVTSLAALALQEGQPPELLSGSLDGTLRRWNAVTGQQLVQLNHGGPVTAVAVSADRQRWASASDNKTIKLWNATNNQQLAEMRGDLRAKALVASLTQQKNDATAKLNAAKVALDAAEKDVPVKLAAEKTATDALAAALRDMQAKATALTMASTVKAEAEKVAIQAAAVAQKAATAMEEANQRALELAAKSRLLADDAARAQAAASVEPANADLAKVSAA
ncbi:MAG: hypothetical protein J5I93_26315, partial [Pirellulaceae bacterium]|nr:hypothetical protein [Pirellulaceae bacterium]